MKREGGFYWVLYSPYVNKRRENAEWIVAEYYFYEDEGCWLRPGAELEDFDSEFLEIDEHRIVRNDP